MSEMKDKDRGWDEMAAIWQAQPVPDVRKIADQVQTQHRRLIWRQRHEIIMTIMMVAIASAMLILEPDAWYRAWFLVVTGYVIVQQYLMLRAAKGLFRKHDTESVKDMLGHLARYHRQRIYRFRLRILKTVVIPIATIPLLWHLAPDDWSAPFSDWTSLIVLAVAVVLGIALNVRWVFRGMPRLRRALDEAESLRQALAGDEEKERGNGIGRRQ